MKRFLLAAILSFGLATQLLAQLHACSLCSGAFQRDTLGMEYERASLVLYGQVTNSRFNGQPGAAPGTGSSDFQVEKVLKDATGRTGRGSGKIMVLPRYVPVLDAKNPPRMLFFCDIV